MKWPNLRPTAAHPGYVASPELAGPSNMEDGVPPETTEGADEVGAGPAPLEIDEWEEALEEDRANHRGLFPKWRVEELARKYDDNEHEERYERGFYHPYG